MAKRIDDAKRAAIVADVRAREKSRNQIARDHGVSPSTVSMLATLAGLTDAFDRAETKSATAARVTDMKAQRAATSARFLAECNALLDQLHQPHLAFNFGGKDNTYEEHQFDEPPVDAKRTLMTAAAIAFDKHIAQARHDADDDGQAEAARSLLGAVLEGLQARHGSADAAA